MKTFLWKSGFIFYVFFFWYKKPKCKVIFKNNGQIHTYVIYRRRQWHPLQYSCLENPMDRGAWWAVHGVTESQMWLSDFTFTFHFYALQKEMATHPSVLAWRIPGTGSHRVRHVWSDLAVAAIAVCYIYMLVEWQGRRVVFIAKTNVYLSLIEHSLMLLD